MNAPRVLRAGVLLLAALLAGCATWAPVALEYRPGELESPMQGRKPRLLFRGVTDGSEGVRIRVKSDAIEYQGRPVPDVLRDALTAELARLDVPVVRALKDADAELLVTVKTTEAIAEMTLSKTMTTVLSAYGLDTLMNSSAVPLPVVGTLKLTLTLKSPTGETLWRENVVGRGLGRPGGTKANPRFTGNEPNEALNGALADAMRKVEDLFVSGEIGGRVFGRAAVAEAAPQGAGSDVDQVPAPSARERRAHAVVIGVERYKADLPSADFAAGDAQLVGKYLTALGFPKQNVVTLVNDGASRGDIEKYVERWLPNRVQEGDAVVVYFSGHGSPNPVSGDAYLVPFDGDPTYLDQTAYPISRLYASLAKLPTKDVTVVLDSCFSGAGGRSVIAKGARPLVNARLKTQVPEPLTVLTAAAANQISQSYQDKGHGLFTYFFLKALKKQAGGALDFRAAFDETAPQVTDVARQEYNAEQVPQWQGSH